MWNCSACANEFHIIVGHWIHSACQSAELLGGLVCVASCISPQRRYSGWL